MRVFKTFGLMSAIVCACSLLASSATATTIFSDDFESYADTTAMQAVWTAAGAGSLDAGFGNPGQSASHPGGAQNQVSIAPVIPTAAAPLVYSVDIYDDGTSANKRMTAGLRNAGVANLIEMGMYNNPNHYAVRAVLPGPSWIAFSNMVDDAGDPIANEPVEGWHTYTMVHDGTTATFTLDLNGDGNINATQVIASGFNAGFGFDTIRMSVGLSSAGGGANFDNYSLSIASVPEPSTALLALISLGALVGRRKS